MRGFTFSHAVLSASTLCSLTTALPIDSLKSLSSSFSSLLSRQLPQQQLSEPVIPADFADPSFIQLQDGYYAFATSVSMQKYVQVARSDTFDSPDWSVLNIEALPDPGAWTDHSTNVWAPYVAQLPSGSFIMYYSAPAATDPSKHCIGTATSSTITGPYVANPAPFTCPLSAGGAIDPAFFTDPTTNNAYVLYKIDGNSLDTTNTYLHSTPIMLQQVNPADGVTPIGPATQLIDRTASDGPLIEAPMMTYSNGLYFLLFSSQMYNTNAYNLKYVSASSITGPYSAQQVLLDTGDGNGVRAPGSGDIHDGQLVFHGTVAAGPVRNMYAGNVKVSGSTLQFEGCQKSRRRA